MLKQEQILICKTCHNFPLQIQSYNLKQVWKCEVCATKTHLNKNFILTNRQLTLIDDNFWLQYQRNSTQNHQSTSIIFIELSHHLKQNHYVRPFTQSLLQQDQCMQTKMYFLKRLFDQIYGVHLRNNDLKRFKKQRYQKRRNVIKIQSILTNLQQYLIKKVNKTPKNGSNSLKIILLKQKTLQLLSSLQLHTNQITFLKNQQQRKDIAFQQFKKNKKFVQFIKSIVSGLFVKIVSQDTQHKMSIQLQGFVYLPVNRRKHEILFYCQQFQLIKLQSIGIKKLLIQQKLNLDQALKQKNINLIIYQFSSQNKATEQSIHQRIPSIKMSTLKQQQSNQKKQAQHNTKIAKHDQHKASKTSETPILTQDEQQFVTVFYSRKDSDKIKIKIQYLQIKIISQIRKLLREQPATQKNKENFKKQLTLEEQLIIISQLKKKIDHYQKSQNNKTASNCSQNHKMSDSYLIHKIFCKFINQKSKKVTYFMYVFDWLDKIKENFVQLDCLNVSTLPQLFKISQNQSQIKEQVNKIENKIQQQRALYKKTKQQKQVKSIQKRRKRFTQQSDEAEKYIMQSEIDKYKDGFKKKKAPIQINLHQS